MNARSASKLFMLSVHEAWGRVVNEGCVIERRPDGLRVYSTELNGCWPLPFKAVEKALANLQEQGRVVCIAANDKAEERWARAECWVCDRSGCTGHTRTELDFAKLFGSDGAPLTWHCAMQAGVNSIRPYRSTP